MNRRAFIQALSRSPVVATIASRVIAERTAMDLALITKGLSSNNSDGSDPPQSPKAYIKDEPEPTPQQWKLLLRNQLLRSEVESVFYEDYRVIGRIDPDIAVLRSLSLNAKIAFQRQRIVARNLENLGQGHTSPWYRIRQLSQKYLKQLLLGG